MIKKFRRRGQDSSLHPADQHLANRIVVGDHSHPQTQDKFQQPQEVAAAEEQQPASNTADNIAPSAPQPQSKHRRSFKEWIKSLSKKQWAIIIIVIILLIGGGVTAFFMLHHNKPAPKPTHTSSKAKPAPQPTTVASNLTGVQVDPSVNQRPVTGLMIENHPDARPQSGLGEAGVIFEAVAEGGITRFLALYQDNITTYIGPVRSVRPYYIQWDMGFDGALAHVGGSAEGLYYMKTWGVKDLDQFANSSYFHRIGSRVAPHNVYTSIGELNTLEAKKGFGAAKYTPLQRKKDEPTKTPVASSIDLNISSALYNVHYDYNPEANSYKRFQGGAPHTNVTQDGVSAQLGPKVVVALVMNQGIAADDHHTAYGATGSNYAYIFQDGKVYVGNWHKDGNTGQFTFTDFNNQPIKLNAGQTWFTVVGDASRISYKP